MDAEVIFETGSKSVLDNVTEDELKSFLTEHNRRAQAGDVGGPTGHPAERISKVLLYDQHPATYNPGAKVSADALATLIDGMKDANGQVDSAQLIAAINDEISPTYPQDQGRHESIYKMPETGELDLSFLSEGEAA